MPGLSLPFSFPIGGDPYAPSSLALRIDYIADWSSRLLTRLYEQFKDKTKILSIVTTVIAPQVQALEDAFQQLTTLRSIDSSFGAQLDAIGRIVGQLRLGYSDVNYRSYLRARIRANLSRGTPEDMLAVLRLLVNDSTIRLAYRREPPAGYTLEALGVTSDALALISASMLGDANRAGVRLIYLWQESPSPIMFTLSDTPSGGANDGPISSSKGTADTGETSGGHLAGAIAP